MKLGKNTRQVWHKKPTDFTIERLKEILDNHVLSTAGTEIEVIARLNQHDSTGQWKKVPPESESRQECEPSLTIVREDGGVGIAECSNNNLYRLARTLEHLLREVGRLAGEVENLRGETVQPQDLERSSGIVVAQPPQMKKVHVSVKSIAELLRHFDGKSEDFPNCARHGY